MQKNKLQLCNLHLKGLINAIQCLELRTSNCLHVNCDKYKNLKEHIYNCEYSINIKKKTEYKCKYDLCYAGKLLLIHYKMCTQNQECGICKDVIKPLKHIENNQTSEEEAQQNEKFEVMRAILGRILHARDCHSRHNTGCEKDNCGSDIEKLKHIISCECKENSEECKKYKKYKYIYYHWLICGKIECNICYQFIYNNSKHDDQPTAGTSSNQYNTMQQSETNKNSPLNIEDEDVILDDLSDNNQYVSENVTYTNSTNEDQLNDLCVKLESLGIQAKTTVEDATYLNQQCSTDKYSSTKEINLKKDILNQQDGQIGTYEVSKSDNSPNISSNEHSAVENSKPLQDITIKNIQQEQLQITKIHIAEDIASSCGNTPSISTETQSKKLKIEEYEALEQLMQNLESLPPIDLSTIKNNLIINKYVDPWEFINDVWLVFENIWLINHKNTKVYKKCTQLCKEFEKEINPVMIRLGYCCGNKYTYNVYCTNCCCLIPNGIKYYSSDDKRIILCKTCNESGNSINFDVQSENIVLKNKFKERKNQFELESFVICNACGRKQHQICELYLEKNWPHGFMCHICNKGLKENKFSAKLLPTNKLGIYIETRVNNFLKMKESGAGKVHIRVVSNFDKIVEVKPEMRRQYVERNELCGELKYRAKAVFAFEEVDGVDVCFFGMHVQEYGSECPAPNTRRVYIGYLDSVHFFKSKHYRTAVYHEILLGYMDYVKQLGFTMAHIWACPPSEGDDYMFHCHPPEQKIPKAKRLQEWYKKLLDKGIEEGILKSYKNQATEDDVSSAVDLPYFEGDFWPKKLEEILEKGPLKTKLSEVIKKHKENFFVIRLHSVESANSLAPIQDTDPLLNCDLMDGRDAFLTMARDKHYEFSSLRRTQFSTLNMLYELHIQVEELRIQAQELQNQAQFVYTCNNCKTAVKIRYHCTVCDDFDLCSVCKDKIGHPHDMIKLALVDQKQSIRQYMQRCIQSLEHACQCRNANCILPNCAKMKCYIEHTKACHKKAINGCTNCKQVITLCRGHAENCKSANCQVLFCKNIKERLEQNRRRDQRRFENMSLS